MHSFSLKRMRSFVAFRPEKPSPVPGNLKSVHAVLWIWLTCIAILVVLEYSSLNWFSSLYNKALPRSSNCKTSLQWWRCPDSSIHQCTFLDVPIQYSDNNVSETLSIFLRKLPASVHPRKKLGTLLVNPGGPGASGNAMVARKGKDISIILDGMYDIVGFDPRGVNMTTPSLGCFSSDDAAARFDYSQSLLGLPFEARRASGSSLTGADKVELAFIRRFDATVAAVAQACVDKSNPRILNALSTSLVVKDMIRIIEALGEESQGLSYWGRSYGTVIGSTFAAMRPDLVHRMVLDGVIDVPAYYDSMFAWGRSTLIDANKTYHAIFELCAQAGPEHCAFARPNATADDLKKILDDLYNRVLSSPLPVSSPLTGAGILTASDIKAAIFESLYAPKSWPWLAQALRQTVEGNGTLLYDANYGTYVGLPREPTHNTFGRYMHHFPSFATTASIMCSDTAKSNANIEDSEFQDYLHELFKMSPTSETWALWMGWCRKWKVQPVEKYDGPWSIPDGLRDTKNPILLISLTADPITPLASGVKMANAFGPKSATLLVQDGLGHCSFAHPSLCTAKAIRRYFIDGVLPDPFTVCQSQPGFPFTPETPDETWSENDRKLLAALERLSQR